MKFLLFLLLPVCAFGQNRFSTSKAARLTDGYVSHTPHAVPEVRYPGMYNDTGMMHGYRQEIEESPLDKEVRGYYDSHIYNVRQRGWVGKVSEYCQYPAWNIGVSGYKVTDTLNKAWGGNLAPVK